jgi:copper chaperone CopZ
VGKAALEGLRGVSKVTSGWHGAMEINTVTYDKKVISVKEMEEALRKAGTYLKTFPQNTLPAYKDY